MLRSSDPAIWAAGDVASAVNPLFGERVRVEHWANASNQGKAAGLSMADQGEPYAKLPYFFTDQYDLGMEYHGWVGPDGYDDVVLRGDPESAGVAGVLAGRRPRARGDDRQRVGPGRPGQGDGPRPDRGGPDPPRRSRRTPHRPGLT